MIPYCIGSRATPLSEDRDCRRKSGRILKLMLGGNAGRYHVEGCVGALALGAKATRL